MDFDLSIIVPYFNGQKTIVDLLQTIPSDIPVLIVDDQSDEPVPLQLISYFPNVAITRLDKKGFFTGAVNAGISSTNSDVLILNQDAKFQDDSWLIAIADNRDRYALIGERIAGNHPAFPNGYIQGTFMYIRRDAISRVGLMNETDYPLWGSTCEYQLRVCRAGFEALPMRPLPGLVHDRTGRFGEAITTMLRREPENRSLFIRTPPEISVIVPCYNYGRYLPDLVASFVGGETSLGYFEQQTFGSFEIVIVDDCSKDDTPEWIKKVVDPWKGVRSIRLNRNVGTAAAINAGVQASFGKYITVLGSDDMRETWALEALYRVAIQNPQKYVYDQILAFASGVRRPDINVRVRSFNPADLIHKNHVHAGILLPKKAWYDVGGYPESMNDGREDWAMNVALLANGWCGVFVDAPGYLYRREKQNRTLRNTSQEEWRRFKAKIMQMYPEFYDGRLDPMACCGGGRKPMLKTANQKVSSSKKNMIVPGGEGVTVLRYVGSSQGKQSFYGPITGAQYEAGLTKPLIAVDTRDLHGPNARQVGMLDRVEQGKQIFIVEPAAKRPAPIEQPPAPVETPEETEVVEIPDPSTLTVSAIKKLELSRQGWNKLGVAEIAGKNRASVVEFAKAKRDE